MFQFRRFPSCTYVFSAWYPKVGFPIRKSPDQCLFAAPRSLSQLITSFIGSWCQGIPLALLLAWSISISLTKKSPIFGSLISRIMQAQYFQKFLFTIIVFTLNLKIYPLLLPSHNCINYHNVQFSRYTEFQKKLNEISLSRNFSQSLLNGGEYRDRTGDLLLARQALSQLS